MKAACDLLIDSLIAKQEMIIRKPMLIIQDFKTAQNTYSMDHLKKRILNRNNL